MVAAGCRQTEEGQSTRVLETDYVTRVGGHTHITHTQTDKGHCAPAAPQTTHSETLVNTLRQTRLWFLTVCFIHTHTPNDTCHLDKLKTNVCMKQCQHHRHRPIGSEFSDLHFSFKTLMQQPRMITKKNLHRSAGNGIFNLQFATMLSSSFLQKATSCCTFHIFEGGQKQGGRKDFSEYRTNRWRTWERCE